MIGFGTIVNAFSILLGGILGLFLKNKLEERFQTTLMHATGISVIFLAISSAMEQMLVLQDLKLVSQGSIMIIISMSLGSFIGELLNIENLFSRFGQWLKIKSHSQNDSKFVDAFLMASFTVCIGAMAIVGAIEDGLNHNYSILFAKSILDFLIIMVMSASKGKGCIFSFIPVFIFQGSITLFAFFIQSFISPIALAHLSLIGALLIFCIGTNLALNTKIKVANMLPALVIAYCIGLFF